MKDGADFFFLCFSQDKPKWMGPDEHLTHVSSLLGSRNTSSAGLENCFTSSLGKAGLVTL